jgi:hypothetical protein
VRHIFADITVEKATTSSVFVLPWLLGALVVVPHPFLIRQAMEGMPQPPGFVLVQSPGIASHRCRGDRSRRRRMSLCGAWPPARSE